MHLTFPTNVNKEQGECEKKGILSKYESILMIIYSQNT